MNQTQVAALIAELNAMPAGLYSCDANGSACTSYVAQWKVVELVEKHAALIQQAQEPALYMSQEQLAVFEDKDDAPWGTCIPARKVPGGKFTQPLYTTPPAPPNERPAMSEATSQILDDARKALQWLLNNIKQDAPQLSGKAMGNAERVVTAIDAALAQPAPSPQPAVPLVRDLAELLDVTVPDVCKALVTLGFAPRSTNMEVSLDEMLAIKKHFAKPAVPVVSDERPAVEPMTPEQMRAILTEAGYDDANVQARADFINGARYGERHHGITAKAEDAHQPTKEAGK